MRSSRCSRVVIGAFTVLSGCALAVADPALAQAGQGTPVVQALPDRDALHLSSALSRLARNPRDIDALVAAGNAASAMGDFEAAIGFFKRGQQIKANDPRVLAGLAGALVLHAEPTEALSLFAQAERAGAPPASLAANRGLAYDLTGDPLAAQRYYQISLSAGSDPEVLRRLAVSYAISGDERGMERVLLPLLRDQDKAAWRTRAFGLAILGKPKEATKIARTLLPAKLADSISPYLEYMPRLTDAQQAAAANLGVFPRASEIGRDRTAIAGAGTARQPGSGSAASADKQLVPAGKPLGASAPGKPAASVSSADLDRAKRESKEAERRARQNAKLAAKQGRVSPPEPKPAIQPGAANEPAFSNVAPPAVPPVAEIMAGKKVTQTAPASASTPKSAEQPTAAVSRPVVQSAPVASPVSSAVPGPGFDLSRVPTSTPLNAASTQAAPKPQGADADFGSMFADLGKPEALSGPSSGAVDIRKIEPARSKPVPPPPAHPSRIWVQLGIGQKESALAFDWKRMEREATAAFKGRKPFIAKLNQTNRLLAGPFESQKSAQQFVDELDNSGINGPYIWTSPAGQVVDTLPL